MAASYPASVKAFSTKATNDTIEAAHINDPQDEITAIEGGLLNGFGHDLKFTDATYDIGKSGATRPRDLFLSRNATIDGTLDVTGLITGPHKGWTVVTTTSTGTQNDFDPGLSGNTIVRCNNASLLTINGLSGGIAGQLVIIVSVNGQVDLAHEAAGSTAANRLNNYATSAATPLSPSAVQYGTALYQYDGTTSRWRLVFHEQGGWIAATYAAGDWTASAGTWTVDSGDVLADRYKLVGRTLYFQTSVNATDVSTTPQFLRRNLYGFTSVGRWDGISQLNDAAAGNVIGLWTIADAGTTLQFYKVTGNFTATAADNTTAIAQGFCQVS